MKKVLVTGATGFLGSYILKELKGKYDIISVGRNKEKLMEIKKDTTIIFTTHDMDLAYAYGDSIYRIENGVMKCIK